MDLRVTVADDAGLIESEKYSDVNSTKLTKLTPKKLILKWAQAYYTSARRDRSMADRAVDQHARTH